MARNRQFLENLYGWAVTVAAGAAIVLTALILFYRMLSHFPFFDEAVHVHYLWQFSIGLRPGTDFLCTYPALGYLLTLPLMKVLPESAFVVLALRCVSVVLVVLMGLGFYYHGQRAARDWVVGLMPFLLVIKAAAVGTFLTEYSIDHMAALSALAAVLIFMSTPRTSSIAAAAALCALSVAFTPKYSFPLLFGLAGYLAASCAVTRRLGPALGVAAAGAGASLLGVGLIYLVTGTSLTDNLRYAFLLNYRWSSLNAGFGLTGHGRPLIFTVGETLLRNWVFGISAFLGIAGWAKRSWGSLDAVTLSGGGILLGTMASCFSNKSFAAPYVAPVLLCLALFVPYAFYLVRSMTAARVLRAMLVIGTLLRLSFQIDDAAENFRETPFNARAVTPTHERLLGKVRLVPTGILMLSDYDQLLDLIPVNATVVAAWPFHPLFRRDPTVITMDDRPSYLTALAPDDPVRRFFDPEYFRSTLENDPPAAIVVPRLELNYPPGWDVVAMDFLRRHAGAFVPYRTRSYEVLIRRDIAEKVLGQR